MVAFDECSSTKAPDRPRVCARLNKHEHRYGTDGYPMLEITVLCETGTRALLGVPLRRTRSWAPVGPGGLGRRKEVVGIEAPVVEEQHLTVTTAKGLRLEGHYRPAPQLTDHRRYPAAELVELHQERWEIESAFSSLRHTLQHGLVLRSQDTTGFQQELRAHLTVYQALRRAMAKAVETLPDTDPDRASFSVSLETAKDQLSTAADVLPDTGPGRITPALLHDLLPPRRARVNPRRVKCPISRYAAPPHQAQDLGASRITSIGVTVHPFAGRGPDGRRDRTLQLLRTDPRRFLARM